MHLTIDGKTEAVGLLADKDKLRGLLERLPDDMGMCRISGPFVIPYFTEADFLELKGYFGWVIIAESHIAITTNIKDGEVHVDCFSCKDFNAELVLQLVVAEYELSQLSYNILDRTAGH